MSSFLIQLNDLRFYAYIGVDPQERKVGNEYSVDLSITTDADDFVEEDLSTTISYADVYDIVADEMRQPRLLLESTARIIVRRLRSTFPKIEAVGVKITKLAPPIPGINGSAAVEYREWKLLLSRICAEIIKESTLGSIWQIHYMIVT